MPFLPLFFKAHWRSFPLSHFTVSWPEQSVSFSHVRSGMRRSSCSFSSMSLTHTHTFWTFPPPPQLGCFSLCFFFFFLCNYVLQRHLKACVSALFKCFSGLLSWCIHETGEQCQQRSRRSHYCKVADYREQCLHSGQLRRPVFAVGHDESPRNWNRRRSLRTEWLPVALVSPWHSIETFLLWKYFLLAFGRQIPVCHCVCACFFVIYYSFHEVFLFSMQYHSRAASSCLYFCLCLAPNYCNLQTISALKGFLFVCFLFFFLYKFVEIQRPLSV